ncbi:MAG: SAF domain-containing protein [Lachnospiraceae bacterium]|nr:SAF domain-containing protein [Lachnospiraceae bacterium]
MRRFRHRIIICSALGLTFLGIVIFSICFFYGNRIKNMQKRLKEAEEELQLFNSRKVSVLCVSEDIEAGTVICEENLVNAELPAVSVPENTILYLSDAVGKTAKIPLYKNTYITKDMLYESGLLGPEREIEYFCIEISGNVSVGSYVDVRICFEDGSDYVVLARKRIEGIAVNRSSVILHVNEEELLRMGSAIADCRAGEGRRIYAVEYPQGELQEPSIADYKPSGAVADLIEQKEKTEGR